ncbi:uncharacterized protein LOC123428142 [Hordeum vulgare subsp. vulgare]|uniref:Uncharacterized protein n=1 Tax=Hordeum vulgare subsp. vulgare TaxID=112509 RepID=A0A8I7B8A4_HORVV|nr:uncharacterized protein LOC123428142 [Hordeum vulgare subsp. vulgare]KAI5010274.1 hypothetical protein ZWY2020_012411 [Hordeum vulgare]
MAIHLLAFMAAKGFVQVFQVSAPLLWPLNLWLPLPRNLPEVCVVVCAALASHVAWLRRTYARRGSRRSRDDYHNELYRQALLDAAY